MSYTLTSGAVGKLLQGEEVASPVLQILGFKKIAGAGGADRYRVNISDGVYSHSYAMLATQLNHMIPEGKLDAHSIIRVDKVISNCVGEKRVLIILELNLLAKGTDVANKIGNPVQWTEQSPGLSGGAGAASVPRPSTTNGNAYGKPATTARPAQGGSSFYGKKPESSYAAKSSSVGTGGGEFHTGPIIPIRDLNPYNGRCAIRARITNKGDVRTWTNAKGEGKLFSIELLDDTGEIRMTGFNNAVEQFYDTLEVGSVYILKNFQVKAANRAFNSLPHDYELSMGNDTQIIPFTDDTSTIPTASYNFVEIAQIEGMEKDTIIDVIGISKIRGELTTFTSRAGKEMTKRDVILVDKSNREVSLTLWGKQAEDFTDDSQPVVAIKGAKVGDYSGKNLSCLNSSSFMVNPDIPEAHSLRGWYDNEGKSTESRSLSGVRGAGAATPWKVLRESAISDEADSEKGDFFMSKVTVMSVKRDNPAYQACPAPKCQKKVVDMGSGTFRCEKCACEYPDFKWRMMLQVCFADFSGNIWGTCFQETAEILLGQSADVLGPMHKEDPDAFDAVVKRVVFRSYIVKFKSKMETFNNETRRKASVLELHPLNFSEYARKLTAEIKESAF